MSAKGTVVTERPKGNGANGRRRPNSKLLAEARATTAARRSAKRLDVDAIDAIQETLDGMVQDLRFTQKMVDRLSEDEFWRDTMVGRIPNEWIRLRDRYREEVAHFAGSMASRGIAEKAVNVRAAQHALMATMIREALTRAGAPAEMISQVGVELRNIAIEAQSGEAA